MVNKIKKVLGIIVFLTIFSTVGIFIAQVAEKIINYYGFTNDIITVIFLFLILLLVFFLLLIVAYLVHIIIHEAGHLVFGLASGYLFVSFRIGSLTLVRDDGKFMVKKYNIPGTGGQCLMMPPEMVNGTYPFIIYNMGGVLLNLLFSILALFPIIFIDDLNIILKVILIIFIIAGLFVAISNGVPMKIGGIANDAHNVRAMLKDEEIKRAFYIQLRINGLQSKGMRLKDMDLDTFKLKEDSDLSNPLNTGIKLMEHNWYLDNMDFINARACLESLVPHFKDLLPLYVNEINCERIFLELIGDCNKEFIDRVYSKTLQNYIKQSKYMLNKARLLLAYEAFYNEDEQKVEKQYKELKKLHDNYPNKGEADMELMLADWVKDRFDKTKV